MDVVIRSDVFGFQKNGFGGHAILAYDYEYGSYTYSGITYQGCIKICDPNASKAYDSRFNIYFNTNTYNWTIPGYSSYNISSASGAKFNYIGANVNEINNGGYLSGSSNNTAGNFVARIDAYAVGDERSVAKVKRDGANYTKLNASPGDIVEDYSFVLTGDSEGTAGYNLMDGNSAYMVTQTAPVQMTLRMDYENCDLSASSAAGIQAIFDKRGYAEITGESANYTLTMTSDSDYPTDWFAIEVIGRSANFASLERAADGYVLTSDHLKGVKVNANNRNAEATLTFSVDYPSVLLYEVNESTIGVKVDKDGNGTYETVLDITSDTELGDVDGDGNITTADARLALRRAIGLEKYEKGSAQFRACDVDKDGSVTTGDARLILRAVVGLEDPKKW